MPKRWTERELAVAIRARKNGNTIDEIADLLGRTPTSVRRKILEDTDVRVQSSKVAVSWTEKDDDTLSDLYAKGLTSSQIGARMGRSRNSIIGRVHRLGLQKTRGITQPKLAHKVTKPVKHIKLAPVAKSLTPAYFYVPKPVSPECPKQTVGIYSYPKPPHFKGVSLIALEPDECRYPYENTDGVIEFCGQRRKPDSSYCPGCHDICWTTNKG
jgi:hypothetical protein